MQETLKISTWVAFRRENPSWNYGPQADKIAKTFRLQKQIPWKRQIKACNLLSS